MIWYYLLKFENFIDWINKNTSHLDQHSADVAISKIWNGYEVINEFKLIGLGPENLPLYKVTKHIFDYLSKNETYNSID